MVSLNPWERGQQSKFVPLMEFNDTLGTHGSLVSLAVGVDLTLRMLLAANHPTLSTRASFQSFLNRCKLVVGRRRDLEMHFLASSAQEGGTVNAVDGGIVLLAQPTFNIIGIHRFLLDGCSHHPSSEVVGGEILNSLQWNLKRTWHLGHLTSLPEPNFEKLKDFDLKDNWFTFGEQVNGIPSRLLWSDLRE